MVESASRQEEANPVFWLATWAGKISPPWPLRISRKKNFSFRPYNKIILYWPSLFGQDSLSLKKAKRHLAIYTASKNQHDTFQINNSLSNLKIIFSHSKMCWSLKLYCNHQCWAASGQRIFPGYHEHNPPASFIEKKKNAVNRTS